MTAVPALAVGTFPTPFRVVFRHTSAARSATANVVVRLADPDGTVGHGEGTPRSYVTGETVASALEFLRRTGPEAIEALDGVDVFRAWVHDHRAEIDRAPAAFCALELAALDLLARRDRCSIEQLLGLPPLSGSGPYSAVLGDAGPLTFGAQVIRYRLGGLRHYKIKLSGDLARDRAKFRWFRRPIGAVVAHSVRVDANNLWGDPADAIAHLRALDQPLVGVEEPLAANDLDGFAHLSRAIDTPIILDESLLRPGQLERLPDDGARWILNCRVSKSGGLLRSLQLIEAAVDHGLGVIVGAHVGESSLLTRAGLAAAAAAGEALVAQEGAFGDRLLQHDLCAEPLMFGRAGRLGPDQLAVVGPHGLGIEVRPDRVRLDD